MDSVDVNDFLKDSLFDIRSLTTSVVVIVEIPWKYFTINTVAFCAKRDEIKKNHLKANQKFN